MTWSGSKQTLKSSTEMVCWRITEVLWRHASAASLLALHAKVHHAGLRGTQTWFCNQGLDLFLRNTAKVLYQNKRPGVIVGVAAEKTIAVKIGKEANREGCSPASKDLGSQKRNLQKEILSWW